MPPERILRVVVLVVAVLTGIGLVLLWPRGDAPDLGSTAADFEYVDATVTGIETIDCVDPLEQLEVQCQRVSVDITSGSTSGDSATFLKSLIDRQSRNFEAGDEVVLSYNPLSPPDYQYIFFEFQRSTPLLALGLVFVAVVVGFGRLKGIRALLGLAVSLAVIVGFLLPSLLRGNDAIAVALVTTSLIAFAALYLAHGISITTTVALVGTLSSVALITVLAAVITATAELTGLTEESLQILSVSAEAIDPRGILIAGVVIGALGVLDDVTVTQVSAVAELRRANPRMRGRRLYSSAIRIGHDHVASTVNTLVLAYVGAALALMLFFFQEGRSLTQVLSREVVAIEIVRMLIGSIGLVLSVPVTTWLAVLMADTGRLESHHGHGHRRKHDEVEHDPSEVDGPPSWDDFAPMDGSTGLDSPG